MSIILEHRKIMDNNDYTITDDLNDCKDKLKKCNEELKLYKTIFKTHRNSAVFNLKIKKKNGKPVWVDRIHDGREYILSLDTDDEILEWLKPVRCER
jgi:hypothetical protein|tara:strand:- start:146 stop:436 length:291 start_codon:yes stop_codon:yes gene_type:complete